MEKRQNSSEYLTRNFIRLCEEYQNAKPFRKDWVYQVLQFEMLQTIRPLAILSDETIRRYAVDWEDLKSYSKSEKRLHFWRWPASLLFASLNQFLSSRPLPAVLNTGTTGQTFQQSGIEIPSDKYWKCSLELWIFEFTALQNHL